MRVHRDLSWLAEATGRPGKRRGGTPRNAGKSAEKAAPRALGFTHLGGGHQHRDGGGEGRSRSPPHPQPSPRSPRGGERKRGRGAPGGSGRPPPGTGAHKKRGGAGGSGTAAGRGNRRSGGGGHRLGVSPPALPRQVGAGSRDPTAGGAGARHWRRWRVMSLSPKPSGGFRPPPAPPTRRETSPHINGGTGRAAAQSGRDAAVRGAETRPHHAAHPTRG